MTYFPPEIVELIMEFMDGKTFFNARQVNKSWCEIADRLAMKNTLWKKFCQKDFGDIWKSISDKGELSWLEIYKSICLWGMLDRAIKYDTEIKNINPNKKVIKSIFVSKVGILSITLPDKIFFFDAATLQCTEDKIYGDYCSCQFNNTGTKLLQIRDKLFLSTNDDGLSQAMYGPINNVKRFRLQDEECFYVTNNELCVCSLTSANFMKPIILAKWYKPIKIMSINLYKDKIYLLTITGTLILYNQYRLIEINHFVLPFNTTVSRNEVVYICRGTNFIYSSEEYLYISLGDNSGAIYYRMKYITALLMHGNTLIIGNRQREILIYSIKHLDDLLHLDIEHPMRKYQMPQPATGDAATPITELDVYEHKMGGHTLFVKTELEVYANYFFHV